MSDRKHLHEERLVVGFLEDPAAIAPSAAWSVAIVCFGIRDLSSQLLDLQLGGRDLVLRDGNLRLHFVALQVERIDGRLERLFVRADLLELRLVRRDLLVEVGDLLVVCVDLRLKGRGARHDRCGRIGGGMGSREALKCGRGYAHGHNKRREHRKGMFHEGICIHFTANGNLMPEPVSVFYKDTLNAGTNTAIPTGDGRIPPADPPGHVAKKILAVIESGEAEIYAHDWMKQWQTGGSGRV